MKASQIVPGATLALKPEAQRRYGLAGPYQVSHLQTRPGYVTPYVFVKSIRGDGTLLAFRPADFAKAVAS